MAEYDFVKDLFGMVGASIKEWEKELFILYKTDADGYNRKVRQLKTMGYRVMRNNEWDHKVLKK